MGFGAHIKRIFKLDSGQFRVMQSYIRPIYFKQGYLKLNQEGFKSIFVLS